MKNMSENQEALFSVAVTCVLFFICWYFLYQWADKYIENDAKKASIIDILDAKETEAELHGMKYFDGNYYGVITNSDGSISVFKKRGIDSKNKELVYVDHNPNRPLVRTIFYRGSLYLQLPDNSIHKYPHIVLPQ